jgi:hypothetical protein
MDGQRGAQLSRVMDRLVALVELDATRTRGPPPWLRALIRKSGFDGDSLANATCVNPSFGLTFFQTRAPIDAEVAERATMR